jgi:hypothetical protein
MPLRSLFHRATNYKYFSRRRHGAEWRAIATASWNARLPATRSTEDGSAVIDTGSDASTQLKSNFFRKLPLELRRQIYLEVLAGIELLFWVPNEDKSAHGHDVGKEKIPFELSCDAARGLLSFPMSCKLAYVYISFPNDRLAAAKDVPGTWKRSIISTPITHSDSPGSQSTVASRGSWLSRNWI